MSKKKATDAVIFPVADALFARGIEPGPTRVLELIPGGSYTTIGESLKRWRAKREEEAMKEPVPPEVANRAGEFARSLWHGALQHAAHQTETFRRETCGKIESLEVELNGAQAHIFKLEDQVALQSRHLDDARADRSRQQSLIESQADQISRLLQELAESSQAATAARSDQQLHAIHAVSLAKENEVLKKQLSELLKPLRSASDNTQGSPALDCAQPGAQIRP